MPKRFWGLLSSLIIPALIAIFIINQPDPVSKSTSDTLTIPEITILDSTSSAFGEKKLAANAEALRVVDGDTLVVKLDGEEGEWKIRMLGINTPESVDPRRPVECFGKEASEKLARIMEVKRIRLEPDPQADERDKYGRLLRNVWLEDGTDVNALMVREGYAYAYLSFPLDRQRKAELKKLETEAKVSGVGLWATSTCAGIN